MNRRLYSTIGTIMGNFQDAQSATQDLPIHVLRQRGVEGLGSFFPARGREVWDLKGSAFRLRV